MVFCRMFIDCVKKKVEKLFELLVKDLYIVFLSIYRRRNW